MLVTVGFALASALSFGSAVAAQQHVAARLPQDEALRVGLLVRLVRNPLWTAGFLGEILGFGLQLVALHHGSLLVVQPLMTTSLIFALSISVLASSATLARSDWLALAAVVAGLVVFLVVAAPSTATASHASTARWCATIGPLLLAIGWCLITAHRASGIQRAVRIAVASATISAILVAFAKVFSDRLSSHPASILVTWSPYAIAVVGIAAVVVQQSAFQTGRPTATLPILAALEPIVGVLLGVVLFHELPSVDAATVVAGLGGLALLTAGIVKLATDAPHIAEQREGPSTAVVSGRQ